MLRKLLTKVVLKLLKKFAVQPVALLLLSSTKVF